MVCWSEGGILLVVMLVGGLDDVLLTTVASVLRVREARLLVLSYPPCGIDVNYRLITLFSSW